MATTITDVLNTWDSMGVFDYVIPFLLIFAVVFAILKKTGMLSAAKGADGKGDENNGVLAIISVAVGLLSLQFDFVSEFFAVIFPRFGVGLSLFLVLLIFIGFFFPEGGNDPKGWGKAVNWIGIVVGVGVVFWSLDSWSTWGSVGLGSWFDENFWAIVVLGLIIGVIGMAAKGKGKD